MGKTRKLLLLFGALVFLILSLVSLVSFISLRTSLFGRAYGPATGGSQAAYVRIENCYLFASPLQAKANGQEKIRVTAFILDSQGKGVAGETVFLSQDDKLIVYALQAMTDDLGRAIFDISTSASGEYLLEAKVGNASLPQKIKVIFR